MEASSFSLRNNHGIMDEDNEPCHCSMMPSLSPSISTVSSNSDSSYVSDFTEDATSPASSPSSSDDQLEICPLYDMSSLMEKLPIKIKSGLSKHFQGKSQSFTSLSNVRCLEDLAKPDKPYKKKFKSCKSYVGELDSHRSYSPTASSRKIYKKPSRPSFSSIASRRNSSFMGHRPPIPGRTTGCFYTQTRPLEG